MTMNENTTYNWVNFLLDFVLIVILCFAFV